jgi:hypothetical protein
MLKSCISLMINVEMKNNLTVQLINIQSINVPKHHTIIICQVKKKKLCYICLKKKGETFLYISINPM